MVCQSFRLDGGVPDGRKAWSLKRTGGRAWCTAILNLDAFVLEAKRGLIPRNDKGKDEGGKPAGTSGPEPSPVPDTPVMYIDASSVVGHG